eukprot:COSAG04_NODE_30534_length_262_cov_0.631902_1_plen_86_part_11
MGFADTLAMEPYPQRTSMLRNAVWALSNLCRGEPPPDFAEVSPMLPLMACLLLASEDKEVLTDSAWALSYLSDSRTSDKSQALIDA